MNKLTINDLNTVEELSVDAARKISGGLFLSGALIATGLLVGAAKEGAFDSVVENKDDGIYMYGKKVS